MTVFPVFLDEVILLLERRKSEVDLLVRMLDLIVTVVKFVVLNFEGHELLLNSVVVVQLFFQLSYFNLLPGYHSTLVQYLLLNSLLIVLKPDGLRLVASDHLPEFTSTLQ